MAGFPPNTSGYAPLVSELKMIDWAAMQQPDYDSPPSPGPLERVQNLPFVRAARAAGVVFGAPSTTLFTKTVRGYLPVIIGLYAPAAQMGKSEVRQIIAREYGYEHDCFAGPLKEMSAVLMRSHGISEERIQASLYGAAKGEVIPELSLTGRKLMEKLGTDFGREALGADTWVKALVARARTSLGKGLPVVVDDVRNANEFEAIKALGGVVGRVFRDGIEVPKDSRYEGLLEGQNFDFQIHNSAGLWELAQTTHAIMRGF